MRFDLSSTQVCIDKKIEVERESERDRETLSSTAEHWQVLLAILRYIDDYLQTHSNLILVDLVNLFGFLVMTRHREGVYSR